MRLIAIYSLTLMLSSSVSAEDWHQFRGPAGGRLTAISHPMQWSAETNVAWTAPMKGSGWSSPIVVGDRVFLTSAESENSARPTGMMAGVASMISFRSAKPTKYRFVVSCLSLKDGKQL